MNKLISQRIWSDEVPWHFEFRNPQVPYPLHSHNFHEVVFVYSGTATQLLASSEVQIKTGDVICIKPGQSHGYKNVDNLVLMNLLIRPQFFTDNEQFLSPLAGYETLFLHQRGINADPQPIISFSLNKMQLFEVRAIIENMQNELNNMHLGWSSVSTSFLLQLIVLLLRIYNDPNYPDTANNNNSTKLIKYVEKNFNKRLTMQDLIENGNMSESTILRMFKRITGYPPFEYQMRQRMYAAVQKLIYTDWDITQIAYDIGFNDSNYFSRCFKKFINMTPRDYRAKYKPEKGE